MGMTIVNMNEHIGSAPRMVGLLSGMESYLDTTVHVNKDLHMSRITIPGREAFSPMAGAFFTGGLEEQAL